MSATCGPGQNLANETDFSFRKFDGFKLASRPERSQSPRMGHADLNRHPVSLAWVKLTFRVFATVPLENAKARAQRHVLGDPVMASIQSARLPRGCIGQTRSRRYERPTPSIEAGRVYAGTVRHSAMTLSGSEIGVCPGSEIRRLKWRLDVGGTGRQPMSTAMATRGATAHISS